MDNEQIKLLFINYEYAPEQIAELLGKPVSYVTKVLEEEQLITHKEEQQSISLMVNEEAIAEHSKFLQYNVQQLQVKEIKKQAAVAPLTAVTEILLISKIKTLAANIDELAPDAANQLSQLAKAFTTITQRHVTTTMATDQSQNDNKPAIAIQVVTQIT